MPFQSFDTHSSLYKQACELRNEVLRIPIGLDLFDEDLSKEREYLHFGIIKADQILAYVMIAPIESTTATLKQMCVMPNWQRQGVGARLISDVEDVLRMQGFEKITMKARTTAVKFYENLGYRSTGEEFTNVGIPHICMEKLLLR